MEIGAGLLHKDHPFEEHFVIWVVARVCEENPDHWPGKGGGC